MTKENLLYFELMMKELKKINKQLAMLNKSIHEEQDNKQDNKQNNKQDDNRTT